MEAVFSLVAAVVCVQHGAAAMTECGLIPALLNVVQLNMDGQVGERDDADALCVENVAVDWCGLVWFGANCGLVSCGLIFYGL